MTDKKPNDYKEILARVATIDALARQMHECEAIDNYALIREHVQEARKLIAGLENRKDEQI